MSVVEITNTDKRVENNVESTPGSILNRNGKNPQATVSSRKGRRGAIRVTIDPGTPDEVEGKETLSASSGQKGAKETNGSKNQDKETSKMPVSTSGRKRGRQAGKGKPDEEVEETPVRKLRRGQKGKAAQMEPTFLSETPLEPVSFVSLDHLKDTIHILYYGHLLFYLFGS